MIYGTIKGGPEINQAVSGRSSEKVRGYLPKE